MLRLRPHRPGPGSHGRGEGGSVDDDDVGRTEALADRRDGAQQHGGAECLVAGGVEYGAACPSGIPSRCGQGVGEVVDRSGRVRRWSAPQPCDELGRPLHAAVDQVATPRSHDHDRRCGRGVAGEADRCCRPPTVERALGGEQRDRRAHQESERGERGQRG